MLVVEMLFVVFIGGIDSVCWNIDNFLVVSQVCYNYIDLKEIFFNVKYKKLNMDELFNIM